MQRIWNFLVTHPTEVLVGVGFILIGYLIARLLNARPVAALLLSFVPVMVAVGFASPPTLRLLVSLFG
jgi:hypothetical protein